MESWSLLLPHTCEIQHDEKWSFVGKKEKSCDPADPTDATFGDRWDHTQSIQSMPSCSPLCTASERRTFAVR